MQFRYNQGTILLLVMIVLAALIIIVYSFINTVTIDSIIAENQRDETGTYWAAKGGLEFAKCYLELDNENTFDSPRY